jgi:hypothetical protein
MEKVVAGLARVVTALVEKAADELEKAAAGRRRDEEGGMRAATLGHGCKVQMARGGVNSLY